MSDIPTKEQIQDVYDKMKIMFLDGIQTELKSHMADKHTFMYGKNKSIWRATESLGVSKELAIFILMGSNRRKDTWGTLKDNFNLEPLSRVLTPLIVEQCREVSKGYYYRVFFTDRDKLDGNFKLKIHMNPLGKKTSDTETNDNEGFKTVKNPRTYKLALKSNIPKV